MGYHYPGMGWERFQGVNAGYALELYERFRTDPQLVDPDTRQVFEGLTPPDAAGLTATGPPAGSRASFRAVVAAVNLAESIRRYGHLGASIDPFGSPPTGDPSFSPSSYGIDNEDLKRLPASFVGGPAAERSANAYEAIERLREVYCSTTGYDLAQVFVPEERHWLRDSAEMGAFRPPTDAIDADELLDRLTQVDVFERFLHRTFPGKTRFSLEGLDMLVPVLDEIVCDASAGGVRHLLVGMAHRGRLNVLAHILQKPYSQVLAEFKDPVASVIWRIDIGWTGDVKYHAGARVRVTDEGPGQIQVTLAPNPSHLEMVNPVVEGMARAAGTSAAAPGAPAFDPRVTLPLLIHGDAAFPGQGIVGETLNLSRLEGYYTGGSIHIIANNQLGFTATPEESYGTSYASGLARGYKIPILHVNADDAVACIEAARLAWAYRARFGKDFLIDLIGYRRHGHNEGDEPAFTQPLMYRRIADHPTVRRIWIRRAEADGHTWAEAPDAIERRHFKVLEDTFEALKPEQDFSQPIAPEPPAGAAARADTSVPIDRLREINEGLLTRPRGFTIHRKLEKSRDRRWRALDGMDERTIDWATAEELALATIVADGVPVRITGEDVGRGTFSQRHAILHDSATGERFVPLQQFPQAAASFEIHNSPLSEAAVIGFEFGYNVQEPTRLVIWEAQYGDFINMAQGVLDEFVTSGRAKWGLTPSMVFLLPHGHEGQGPDHSSARPERFLAAAADINLRVANCTTAAQYFHLLRRQAALLTTDPLPLVVLTPKSLLRHPAVASTPRDLAEGRFRAFMLDEPRQGGVDEVTRLVLCSGKVFVDLMEAGGTAARGIAVGRLEQLYPFPADAVSRALKRYPALREVVWLQEEPENMGAWWFVRPLLEDVVAERWPIRYLGRGSAASPAEGSAAWHHLTQKALVEQALATTTADVDEGMVFSKRII